MIKRSRRIRRIKFAAQGAWSRFWHLPWRKKIGYSVGATAMFLFVTGVGTYLYFIQDVSSKERIMNRNNTGLILQDRSGEQFFSFYQARSKRYVTIGQIPKPLREAVISAEDKDYYAHEGFSVKSIFGALVADVANRDLGYGGSTITQQLVKITLLTENKNILRKYQELILAREIDRRYSKDEILEMYLNAAYFGEGSFGVEDASKAYFGKSVSQLSLQESAMIAGLLPAPSAYSPISGDPEKAKQRQTFVLKEMRENGYITSGQEEVASVAPLAYNSTPQADSFTAHHFALMVRDELIKRFGEEKVARSGYIVKTTLDLGKQAQAEKATVDQLQRLRFNKASNAAVVAEDPKTGEVLALVGSKSWNDTKFGKVNMATTPRQPGSSFKPLVYSEAIDKRTITAASVLHDRATDFAGYKPENFDLRYRGDVLTRRALANSLNIPAVEVLQKLGMEDAKDAARRMGVTTIDDKKEYGLPLALGSAEIPLVEMTHMYGAWANGGEQPERSLVRSITDKRGSNVFEYKPKTKNVMSAQASYITTSILSDNNARAEEFGRNLTISRPAAVKTGSSENFRDALTIGYTPELVIGVWVGNNDNTPMDQVAGSLGAAPIWKNLMEQYSRGIKVSQFTKPGGIVEASVCSNGAVSPRAGGGVYTEYFIYGTLPKEQCNAQQPNKEVKELKKEEKEERKEEPKKKEEPVTEPEDPLVEDPTDPTPPGETPPGEGVTTPPTP